MNNKIEQPKPMSLDEFAELLALERKIRSMADKSNNHYSGGLSSALAILKTHRHALELGMQKPLRLRIASTGDSRFPFKLVFADDIHEWLMIHGVSYASKERAIECGKAIAQSLGLTAEFVEQEDDNVKNED